MKIVYSMLLAAALLASMNGSSQSFDVRRSVRAAFDTVKILAQVSGAQLIFDDFSTTGSESTRKGSLIINMNQLNDILRNVDAKYRNIVVMLIVSHEMAHQVQFERGADYPPIIKECQADILAGFFIFQYMRVKMEQYQAALHITDPNDPRIYSNKQKFMQEVYAALSAIFDLGEEYTADNTHPRNEQRRVAVRDGLDYGALWLCNEFVNAYPVGSTERNGYIESLKDFKQRLDYLPDDNVLTWSYRHAKYVVHDQRENCKNIIVQNNWKFDTSRLHPYCTYTHRIKNIGSSNITLTFKDQMYTVRRNDPRNTLYWQLVSNQSYLLTIAPDSVKIITGEIEWESGSDIMPSYVTLSSTGSLYSCTSLNYHGVDTAGEYIPALQSKPSNINILDVILSRRGSFKDLCEGIGIAYDKNFKWVYYKSKQIVPFAEKTEIEYYRPSEKYSLYVTLYSGKRLDKAQSQINTLLGGLNELTPKLNIREVKEDQQHTYWEVTDANNKMIGKIELDNQSDAPQIEAGFTVFGI